MMANRLATYLACSKGGAQAPTSSTCAPGETGTQQPRDLRHASTFLEHVAAPALSRQTDQVQRNPRIVKQRSYLPHRPSDLNRKTSLLFHHFDDLYRHNGDEWGFEYSQRLIEILEYNRFEGIGESIIFVRKLGHLERNGSRTKSVWIVEAPQLVNKYGDKLSSERLTDNEMERLDERFEKQQESYFKEVVWQSATEDGRVVAYELSLPGHPSRGPYSARSSATQSSISDGSTSPTSTMGRGMQAPTILLNLDLLEDAHEASKQRAKVLKDLSGPVDPTKRDDGLEQLSCDDNGFNLENATPAAIGNALQGL